MEEERRREEETYPVSPTGQYFNSSVLSISVLSILDIHVPIDDSQTMSLLQHLFLPINPRFSSLMINDTNGVKQWKKVEVNLKDHVKVPMYPPGKPLEFYDNCFNEYLSKIAMDELPKTRPLWELHIFKYPTANSAGNVIFKLHHALGDGYSLMGALLSCLRRADNSNLPLTFPRFQNDNINPNLGSEQQSFLHRVPLFFSKIVNTVSDFGWSLLKSSVVEDDRTPVRSGDVGVEFRPIDIITMTFSLDQIKQMKNNLQVTINDVITGVIFFGTRLYMKEVKKSEMINSNTTALVLLNTRNIAGYTSIDEMVNPDTETQWGNQFGFLHVPVPELNVSKSSNPLEFVLKAQDIIKRKRNSAAVFLTGSLLEMLRKYRGPEATAGYIHSTLKNSSMTISNMIGPVEQMALANHPIRGLYFMVVGVPQSLTITMMSYMGNLRVAVGTEKGFVDSQKFKSCIENAFDIMYKAAMNYTS